MNYLRARNDNISHSGDSNGAPTWYDDYGAWMPQPSIHALSPPMHFRHNGRPPLPPSASTASRPCVANVKGGMGGDNVFDLASAGTPTKAHHDHAGVPKSIAIPVTPGTGTDKTVMDIKITDTDVDDCSSVGMGTVGKEIPRLKRRYQEVSSELLDGDDSSIESMVGRPVSKRMCLKRRETLTQESSIVSPSQELKWDGSLSYLDGLAEHASLMTDNSKHRPRTSTKIDDGMTIGTFDVSGRPSIVVAFPDDQCTTTTVSDDDVSSMESSDSSGGDFEVVAAGTSIPQQEASTTAAPEKISWDGSFTFMDSFDKTNASLMDFLAAEAAANCSKSKEAPDDYFLPPNFAYSTL